VTAAAAAAAAAAVLPTAAVQPSSDVFCHSTKMHRKKLCHDRASQTNNQ
jgi:hypothetical protein